MSDFNNEESKKMWLIFKKYIFILTVLIIVSVLFCCVVFADETGSYVIKWSISCEGGGHGSSSNYHLFDAFGFPMFGSMSSSSYHLSGGKAIGTNVNSLSGKEVPDDFNLQQNYPNPFNPHTTIRFELPEPATVEIVLYNVMGQKVKTLFNQKVAAGFHQCIWDGLNDAGEDVGSGTYIFIIRGKSNSNVSFQDSKKMTLVR